MLNKYVLNTLLTISITVQKQNDGPATCATTAAVISLDNSVSASTSAHLSTSISRSSSTHSTTSSTDKAVVNSTSCQPRGLVSMLERNNVTKAEIVWCLHIVHKHDSYRSGADAVSLFPLMFPDSEIASRLKLHRTKISYVINFGLGQYFFRELQDMCTKCDYVVIGFDESVNKVSQKGQMDAFVRFWDPLVNQVSTRYYGSAFLGHAKADDLMTAFRIAITGLDIKIFLQISMDGPNVNKKFLKDLKAHQKEENPAGMQMLDIGSCGIHTTHNAYKKAMKITSWKIESFLRALYYLFCYSPARRADYTKFSGSIIFPLKFCAIRWVENFKVAERALIILPNIRKYVEGVKEINKVPACNSFEIVNSALKDKLLPAKLAFCQSLSSEVEPFLTRFQTSKPLSPLMYESLTGLVQRIMGRFVKDDVLKSAKSIAGIDLNKDSNLLTAQKIDLGFSVRHELRKERNIKDNEILQFRNDSRKALKEFCISILAKSPLIFPLTKGISCFDPAVALKSNVRSFRLDKALEIFVEHNLFSGYQADAIKRNYDYVCKQSFFTESLSNFSTANHRLDDFWVNIIPKSEDFDNLRLFLKMILILSHGNAFSESGFSINKEILIENLAEESLVAQRQVYDAIMYHGGVEKVKINNNLIHAVRNSSDRYYDALKKKKEKEDEISKEKARKRHNTEMLRTLAQKKAKLLEEARRKVEEVELEMKQII